MAHRFLDEHGLHKEDLQKHDGEHEQQHGEPLPRHCRTGGPKAHVENRG